MIYIIFLNSKKIDKCNFIHSYVELDLQDSITYFDVDAFYLINVCILWKCAGSMIQEPTNFYNHEIIFLFSLFICFSVSFAFPKLLIRIQYRFYALYTFFKAMQ